MFKFKSFKYVDKSVEYLEVYIEFPELTGKYEVAILEPTEMELHLFIKEDDAFGPVLNLLTHEISTLKQ